MATKKKHTSVEWVGGLVSMPAYVTGEGEPYRPDLLLWMSEDGLVLGSSMAKPGEALDTAADHLRSTIARPMIGAPHAPTRVRVASPDLAEVLRPALPAIEVVCAPTPEVDLVLAGMRDGLGPDDDDELTYLAGGIDAEAVASFFRAAAGLYRAKPWALVPTDQDIFSVTSADLGLRDAALSVMGQGGECFGLVLFAGVDDFEAYLRGADAIARGEQPRMPPYSVLDFERGAEVPGALRKEVAANRWEVAGANAYPWVTVVDDDAVPRPPTAKELTIAEAIALALPKLLDKKALAAAWKGGAPVVRTLSVKTHARDVEITLRAPYEEAHTGQRPPAGLMRDLFDLAPNEHDVDEELDDERRHELEDHLVHAFVTSPEANALASVKYCNFVMDYAASHFGATIATLGPRDLRAILFDIIPGKLSVDAEEARAIIDETRALYAFLKREHALEHADACLQVLEGDAVKKLEAALADPSKFGMAKSMLMGARAAGYDVDTKEGLEAWMRAVEANPLSPSLGLPSFQGPARPADSAAARAKSRKRRAARKARRKNR